MDFSRRGRIRVRGEQRLRPRHGGTRVRQFVGDIAAKGGESGEIFLQHTEGVFAHLEICVQRLAQEDGRELWGWHPEAEAAISRLRVTLQDGRQTLIRERTPELSGERK